MKIRDVNVCERESVSAQASSSRPGECVSVSTRVWRHDPDPAQLSRQSSLPATNTSDRQTETQLKTDKILTISSDF